MAPESSDDKSNDVYLCPHQNCRATFSRPSRLKHHLSVHEGQKPYACSVAGCSRAYVSPAGLKRHSASHSSDLPSKYMRKYLCTDPLCGQLFTTNQNMQKHFQRAHTKIKYKCDFCSESFLKNQQLKMHTYQHTGIKPFSCSHEDCNKSFDSPGHLKQHQKTHIGYACPMEGCEYRCEKWTVLRKHKKLQHPVEHKCQFPDCNKIFRTKSNLRMHASTHSLEREIFVCQFPDCRRFYYCDKNLRYHVRSAHEGRRYRCAEEGCGREFKHKVVLDRHMKLHSESGVSLTKKNRTCRKRRTMLNRLTSFKIPEKVELKRLQDENRGQDASATSESDAESVPAVVLMWNPEGNEGIGCYENIPEKREEPEEDDATENTIAAAEGQSQNRQTNGAGEEHQSRDNAKTEKGQ